MNYFVCRFTTTFAPEPKKGAKGNKFPSNFISRVPHRDAKKDGKTETFHGLSTRVASHTCVVLPKCMCRRLLPLPPMHVHLGAFFKRFIIEPTAPLYTACMYVHTRTRRIDSFFPCPLFSAKGDAPDTPHAFCLTSRAYFRGNSRISNGGCGRASLH